MRAPRTPLDVGLMQTLPETMAEVTPDWLQCAVGAHPAFAGKQIVGIHGTPLGVGIGQMSDLARVELVYSGQAGPTSVVVKLHTPFETMRHVGVRYEMYARETAFYQSFASEVAVRTPLVYFAAWDPGQRRNAIVMQDLVDGYWPDQLAGPTPEQAEHCVDALARLGARHWNADFTAHPWLPDTRAPLIYNLVEDYKFCSLVMPVRLQAYLPPAARQACERIVANIEWLLDQLAEPPLLLTHFDCRLENFVFADASARGLILIDWQLVSRTRPGWDFAYFVGTCMDEDNRRLLQKPLTARYLAGLSANGVTGYQAREFKRDFRLCTMAMTIIPVIGGASFDTANARSLELFGNMAQRAFASVLDNDCLDLLPA